MTLGRCPLSIFCSRGTPPESIKDFPLEAKARIWPCLSYVCRICSTAICQRQREFFIDNLLVRTHCIILMIRWTGLAPWEFEFPFPGSLTSTSLERSVSSQGWQCRLCVFFERERRQASADAAVGIVEMGVVGRQKRVGPSL